MAERSRGPNGRNDGIATARSFWSGTLSFGLVSIPVDLMTATARRGVAMRMLAADGVPLRRRYRCPRDGAILAGRELVRGYEFQPGRFLAVSDEELDALAPERSRDISLQRFVPRASVPPLYFERAYFLAPAGGSARAYHLLVETMDRAGRAGVATFVMRGKEQLIAIVAEGGVLHGEVLRFGDEVRSADDVGLPAPRAAARLRVAQIARDIEAIQGRFDHAELRDEQADGLRALAERKRAEDRDVVKAPELAQEEDEAGEVVDLLQVLKQRLGEAARHPSAPEARQPTTAADRGASSASHGERDEASTTKAALYERARRIGIRGRSRMSKEELETAIRRAG